MTLTPHLSPAAHGLAPAGPLHLALRSGKTWLNLPFDGLRAQHALAVRMGLIERSLLASARFERSLASLEQVMLGPLARRR